MPVLFPELTKSLLHYKKSSPLGRTLILLKGIADLAKLPKDVTTTAMAKNAYTKMAFFTQLITYANHLKKIENCEFFEMLGDYNQMGQFFTNANVLIQDVTNSRFQEIDAQYVELNNYFEIKPFHMRLRKDFSKIPQRIWDLFHTAQLQYLADKGLKWAITKFDVNHLPTDQLYSLPQMLGQYNNEAVDRVCANSHGRFAMARNPQGMLQCPGGGMIEIDLKHTVETKRKKMLDEYLEEENGELFQTASLHYNGIDQKQFSTTLLDLLKPTKKDGKSTPSLFSNLRNFGDFHDEFQHIVSTTSNAEGGPTNAQILNRLVHTISSKIAEEFDREKLAARRRQEADAFRILEASSIQDGEAEDVTKARLAFETEQLDIANRDAKNELDAQIKLLRTLKASVQVETFKLCPVYDKALQFIKENSKTVMIDQPNDLRRGGGKQLSHTSVMQKSLDSFFEANGIVGRHFADDLTGAKYVHLQLLDLLCEFKTVRFSHIITVLAGQLASMDHGLAFEKTWDAKKYNDAGSTILESAKALSKTLIESMSGVKDEINQVEGQLVDLDQLEEGDKALAFKAIVPKINDVLTQIKALEKSGSKATSDAAKKALTFSADLLKRIQLIKGSNDFNHKQMLIDGKIEADQYIEWAKNLQEGKSSPALKALGWTMMSLCVSAIALGLAVVLSPAMAAVVGVTAVVGASVAATTGVVAGITGGLSFFAGRQKGLSRSVCDSSQLMSKTLDEAIHAIDHSSDCC